MMRSVSCSLPTVTSSFFSYAIWVRSLLYWSRTGVALPAPSDFALRIISLYFSSGIPMAAARSLQSFCRFTPRVCKSLAATDWPSCRIENKICSVPAFSLPSCCASSKLFSKISCARGVHPFRSIKAAPP